MIAHEKREKLLSYNTMLLSPLNPFLRYISHESISVSVSSKGIISRLNPLIINNEKGFQMKEFRG